MLSVEYGNTRERIKMPSDREASWFVFLARYYKDYQSKGYGIGEACSTHDIEV